jgi:hypothetical protein
MYVYRKLEGDDKQTFLRQFQALDIAGVTKERRLFLVACKRLLYRAGSDERGDINFASSAVVNSS